MKLGLEFCKPDTHKLVEATEVKSDIEGAVLYRCVDCAMAPRVLTHTEQQVIRRAKEAIAAQAKHVAFRARTVSFLQGVLDVIRDEQAKVNTVEGSSWREDAFARFANGVHINVSRYQPSGSYRIDSDYFDVRVSFGYANDSRKRAYGKNVSVEKVVAMYNTVSQWKTATDERDAAKRRADQDHRTRWLCNRTDWLLNAMEFAPEGAPKVADYTDALDAVDKYKPGFQCSFGFDAGGLSVTFSRLSKEQQAALLQFARSNFDKPFDR